ncbi:hypothetical protein, partial [Blautia sp. MSK.21.1]|uniref:hypothetical protein n=1 Tax=Blautia sp. MSK.21.1 TaxID=2742763 RepID=UPI002ED2AFCB
SPFLIIEESYLQRFFHSLFLIGSLSGIAVLGDVIRGYLPVNLILIFLIINAGLVLLRISIGENEYI